MRTRSLDLHHHQRAIIRDGAPLGILLHYFEHAVGQCSGRKLSVLFKDGFQPSAAEKLSFGIAGFRESVRIKNENISRVEFDAPLLIRGIVKYSDRKSLEFELFDAAILPKQRLRLPRIGDAKLAASLLPGGKTKGHVAALHAANGN